MSYFIKQQNKIQQGCASLLNCPLALCENKDRMELLIQIVRNGLSQGVGYGSFLFIPFELSDLENKNQPAHNTLIKKIISTVEKFNIL